MQKCGWAIPIQGYLYLYPTELRTYNVRSPGDRCSVTGVVSGSAFTKCEVSSGGEVPCAASIDK